MPDMSETQQNLRDPRDLQLTVLGLGEAGAIFAAGIAAASGGVRGFDPADVGDPPGVDRCATAAEAVTGAGVVIALTHAGQAMTAAQSAVGHLRPGSYYPDFATGDPLCAAKAAGNASDAEINRLTAVGEQMTRTSRTAGTCSPGSARSRWSAA
jgi:3-hydroxyisobutyrate dehydrogenase-like beta-hydroxyacid dehydrogenase